MSEQTRIAFLGLGAMGQRMASRLEAAGWDVVVWSRSGVPASARSLSGRAVATAQAAVSGADLVFSMLKDDDASRAVWLSPSDGALSALRAGAVAVECSTLSPAWASELSERMARARRDFIEAPVVGSRPQAEAGSLVFLAAGDPRALDRVRPSLACMGGAVHHLGAAPAAAYAKLIVNALLGVQVAALAELIAFADRAELDLSSFMTALEGLPVLSAAAKNAAAGILARRFEPAFPVELMSKDLRYVLSAAEAVDRVLPVVQRVSEVFETGRSSGHAHENLTAVAKLYT
ncbi:MAG: 3-hydroxyisobutyrate dehydrogenase [Myxococcaceae bacterium]|nr:3-hydroxyisobutyrate dehydrogenase [Myxococcaceae bacterium]